MRRTRFVVFALVACFILTGIAVAQPPAANNFQTHLSGDEEVPPIETDVQGQAIFHFSTEENALLYKLIVANIEGVTQAHIHCAPEGANGSVVAFLYGFFPGGLDANGVLAQGTLNNGDIITRPDSAACPGGVATLADVVEKMRAGNTYVNVHTIANPGGEIRGQIHPAGPDLAQ